MARLFIPGPTDVLPEALAAQTRPIVDHRSQALRDPFARVQPGLRQVLGTRQRLYSRTVTAIRNPRLIDITALNAFLALHDRSIANSYGRLKNRTFRIAHMGEIQLADIEVLLDQIDEFLAKAS